MKASIRPLRDQVLLRPRPELVESTTTLKVTRGDLEALSPHEREIVRLANTVGFLPLDHMQAINTNWTTSPEALTFGEVLRVGEGREALAEDRPALRKGDIVGFKRNRIAHDVQGFDRGGQPEKWFMVHEHGIPVRYPEGAGLMPEPLGNWVVTRPDPEAAQRALGKELPLTPEEVDQGIVTRVHETPGAHHGSSRAKAGSMVANKARMLIERVVSTGPGRWVKAIWPEKEFGPRHRDVFEPNRCAPGELVGLLPCNSRARFRLHGRPYSLIEWSDFICAWDEDEREAAE